ncbi:2-pyrone-4,6-dicarboxylate hydrolase [Legionella israelensis]|uniref:2-pyrone-4,6-dicarboxylate hydrolase n=1 Tax=Legionella israelensis TaxID=454 RepID=A0AAX1EDB0_9GAMM|nr:amidohydrolase family protein [Legionella israelensis]QBR83054.1 2-pyrone-4,6-dicarboxylate hydrolase [Legionella israelensis]
MLFDAHFHIIDQRFPLKINHDFLPKPFSFHDYQARMKPYLLIGGTLVAGSFQEGYQEFLIDFLSHQAKNHVGITTLSDEISDKDILALDEKGIKGIRFNLYRSMAQSPEKLVRFSRRIFDLVGWHVELYVQNSRLVELEKYIRQMPKVSIDHLGLTREGLGRLYRLVEKGVRVKATGFMRVDFEVLDALKKINDICPQALMFGTDLPGTRASRPFNASDLNLITTHFNESECRNILAQNALEFYRIKPASLSEKASSPASSSNKRACWPIK